MPNEDLRGDWNAASFSSGELGRCTAVRELHLLGRSRGKCDFNLIKIGRWRIITHYQSVVHTCTPMSLLHPDITVGLGYTGLRVQERHQDASLSTQARVVTMTLFHGVSVILLPQPESNKSGRETYEPGCYCDYRNRIKSSRM